MTRKTLDQTQTIESDWEKINFENVATENYVTTYAYSTPGVRRSDPNSVVGVLHDVSLNERFFRFFTGAIEYLCGLLSNSKR